MPGTSNGKYCLVSTISLDSRSVSEHLHAVLVPWISSVIGDCAITDAAVTEIILAITSGRNVNGPWCVVGCILLSVGDLTATDTALALAGLETLNLGKC